MKFLDDMKAIPPRMDKVGVYLSEELFRNLCPWTKIIPVQEQSADNVHLTFPGCYQSAPG